MGTISCLGVQCAEIQREKYDYANLAGALHLHEGENRIRFSARDAMEHTWSSEFGEGEYTLKVDQSPPSNMKITGIPSKGEELELGEVETHLRVSALDAESGVRSIKLGLDGKELGTPAGECSPGPCEATGEWSLDGGELGEGTHTLTVVAEDKTGNVASKTFVLNVYHASPVGMGPGSVNPQSGDFALDATDVDVSGGGGLLAVTRHYDSRNLKEGEEGPVGPQWTVSLGSLASLEVLPDGSVMVVGPEGLTHFSTKTGGGFEAPPGDRNLTLEYDSATSEYLMKNAAEGTTTGFTLPSGAKSWMPTISKGPIATDTVTDSYQTAEPEAGKKIVEPKLELAPHATASCPTGEWEKWEKACRGLEFEYGNTTTAKGESESEWGEYKGRLKQVALIAYNPSTKAIARTVVAKYEYDGQGRLRDVWNPQISTALKTVYGYDAEGHVTALTSPGQESWAFTYGEIAGDPSTGRLLKVLRAPASTPLWTGGALSNTGAPTLSGSAVSGAIVNASTGTWSGSPIAYFYQWEQCNSEGKACVAIAGATNASYKAAEGDVGHTLRVVVGATNGDGSVVRESAASAVIVKASISEYAAGGKPISICRGPEGNLWYTNTSVIGKITPSGSVTTYSVGSGVHPDAIAVGPDKNLWFTEGGVLAGSTKIGKITPSGTVTEYALPKEAEVLGIVAGPDGNLWFTEAGLFVGSAKIGKITTSGSVTEYAVPSGNHPRGIAVGSDGNLWFSELSTSKIGKITTTGSVTTFSVAKETGGIAAGPDGNLWFTAGSRVGKITTTGSTTEYELPAGDSAGAITPGPEGNMWFTGANKVGRLTTSGSVTAWALPPESEPNGIVAGQDGNVWFVEEKTGKIGKFVMPARTREETSLPSGSHPQSVVEGPDGNVWMVYEGTSKIVKHVPKTPGTTEYALPAESNPYGIAKGPDGNLWFTDSHTSKIGKITTSGAVTEYALPSGSSPKGIVAGPDGQLWFAEAGTSKIGKITTAGGVTEYALPSGSKPVGIAKGPDGELWFTEEGTSKIGKVTTAGVVTEYALPKENRPQGIAAGPDGNLWFTDYDLLVSSTVGKITTSGVITEFGLPALSLPQGIAAGPDGSMWFTEAGAGGFGGSSSIGRITTLTNVISEYALPVESEPHGITSGPEGDLWYTAYKQSELGKINTPIEASPQPPQPGSTIEYNLALSGPGVPQMTETEVAKWGQKDDPVYAMAIFPPDEPQEWPATDYRRAEISYLDSRARAVNSASPSGAISTHEYTAGNALQRSLSADNRAAALKESCETKCKSAEVAKLLDIEDQYNSEEQLTDSWGPQHTVRLAVGKEGKTGEEVPVRNHVHYYYNEGAKEAEEKWHETYDLATKTVDGAETASKEEFDKRTVTTSYSGQSDLGWKLRAPTSTTTDPGGLNLTSTTLYEESTGNVIETRSPASSGGDVKIAPAYAAQFGKVGSEAGQLNVPKGIAMAASGNVYVLDTANNRIDEFSSSGTFIETFGWGVSDGKAEFEVCKTGCKAGIAGAGNGQFNEPYAMAEDTKGNLWVADTGNDRVQEFNSKNEYAGQFGKEGTAEAQFKEPKGIAVATNGNVFVSDSVNNRFEKFNEKGEFQAAIGWGVSNGEAKLETCTSACRAGIVGSGPGQFSAPRGIAVSTAGNVWVVDYSNHRIEDLKENGEYVTTVGSSGTGQGQFTEPKGIAIDAAGDIWVADGAADRIQKFNSSGEYLTSMGTKGTGSGQFEEPWGMAFTTTGYMYIADVKNNRVQRWVPTVAGNTGAQETRTIYYTAKAEAEVAACREHPEWAGLPCQTKPVAQPGVSGLPELPVTTVTYNMWDQAEKTEEAFGATTRTKRTVFDGTGRPLSAEETVSTGASMPKLTDTYNATTGMLETISTTVGETTKTLTSKSNTLGQLETYTDAEGNTATFQYEKEKDARLVKVSDNKGSQSYVYDETTGMLKELVDSAAGKFSASYDVQGEMTSESYPNGMTAYYTRDPAGATTGVEYKKLTDCTEKCVWFSDTVVPSVHGETLKQASTLAEEPSYTYDAAGRLTEVQEVPAGAGCATRLYSYEEDSGRAMETSREPGAEGKCASEGGSTEWHTYDTAGSLADPEVTYDAFGDTTKLPAADAGGSELISEYYLDGQVHIQEQNKEKIEYKLDPEERTVQTISSGNTASNIISHYDGSGGALAWKGEGSGETEKWTRNIPGIDGALTATEKGEGKTGGQPVLLLHDLQGNVVAEAALGETEPKLLKTYNSTEFGCPTTKKHHRPTRGSEHPEWLANCRQG